MRIQKMSLEVAESVAAGEVITQPSAVAKELLENSADAASTGVLLEVVDGGCTLLRSSDDGHGIHPDDLLLSLQSHTTSKLSEAEDLSRIGTYGFRGEALASIRAVARLSLASATEDGRGFSVEASGTRVEEVRSVDMPRGTRVEVQNLFFNVPARRKFLATPATEYRRIRKVFQQYALARPEMRLELHNNQKCELLLPPAIGRDGLRNRLLGMVGMKWADQLIELDATAAGMRLTGWMGSPDLLQARATHQYFFVNERPVFDKLLASAARASLSAEVGRTAQPLLAVWLELEPSHLDVNIHPAKEQVRFLYPRAVHGVMRAAVSKALHGYRPGRKLQVRSSATANPKRGDYSDRGDEGQEKLWVRSGDGGDDGTSSPSGGLTFQDCDATASAAPSDALAEGTLGRALAHLHGVFILAENSGGLVIVDAHAAHERCLLEQTRAQVEAGRMVIQPYLSPLTVSVGMELADVAEEHGEDLQRLGLELSRVSQDAVAVRSLPGLLAKIEPEEMVLTALNDLAAGMPTEAVDSAFNKVLGNLCCRAATKAGMPMSTTDMDELLRAMERQPHSAYCNHGRPSWHQVPMSELNRLCHRGR